MKFGLVLGLTLLLSTPLLASAAEGSPFTRVALLLPPCELPGMTAAELREAVALELQAARLGLAPRGELSPKTDVLVRIDATCPQGTELTLVAEFDARRERRHVELGELAPPQHARALSLLLAELVATFRKPEADNAAPAADGMTDGVASPTQPAASASEASVQPAPTASRPAPAAAPPLPPPPTAEAPRDANADRPSSGRTRRSLAWQPGIGPELRVFDPTMFWGGRAFIRHRPWIGSAHLLVASKSTAPGDITTWLMQLGVTYEVPLFGSSDGARVEARTRLGAGAVAMSATPNPAARAADAFDIYLDAALGAHASFKLAPAVRSGLALEVGYARGPLGFADGVEVSRTAGPFASLLLDATLE